MDHVYVLTDEHDFEGASFLGAYATLEAAQAAADLDHEAAPGGKCGEWEADAEGEAASEWRRRRQATAYGPDAHRIFRARVEGRPGEVVETTD